MANENPLIGLRSFWRPQRSSLQRAAVEAARPHRPRLLRPRPHRRPAPRPKRLHRPPRAASPSRSTGGTSRPATRASPTSRQHRRRLHGREPERHDQDHRPRERGVQDEAVDDGRRPTIRTSSSRGAAASWPQQADAGLLKDITADIADWKDTINPGAMSIYNYNGKQYGVPVGHGHDRLLVQQGALRAGRHHGAAGDMGRVPRCRREAQGRGHRSARDRRQGQVAVDAPVDLPRAPQWWRRRAVRDDPERQLEHRRLHQGRRGCSGAQRARPLPGGLQVGRLQRRGRVRRQRQGGHGADGPVGAVGRDGPERRQEGARRRPRLVRRSRRSTAGPAQPPTASAAATASPSA